MARLGQNRKCNRVHQYTSLNNKHEKHDEWRITLLHYILPIGKGKNNSRFHEFRQFICLLNKHRQNKHNFAKIFKIQVFEVDITKLFPVIAMLKLTKVHKMKGNN